ncbi:MAG TPA: calcium/sodium antiporter [Burkholderiales bacterium]
MNDWLTLALGVVAAGVGGELFVRGAVGLARRMRISPGIIGATVAAFATSSPELSVAVGSALAQRPQISLGDALGSNVVNVGLILALALVISGTRSPRDAIKRDFPAALAAPVLTAACLLDGVLSRPEAMLLFAGFIVWFFAAIQEARRQRSAAPAVLGERLARRAIADGAFGLIMLIAAGRLIVLGAKGIALSAGIGEFVIGATIVAVGTSVPELATAIVSKLRGHDEVGLGTILGSNIFNGLFVVPLAAAIFPIAIALREVSGALIFGLLAVALTFPAAGGWIGRGRGALLLALFAAFLLFTLRAGL